MLYTKIGAIACALCVAGGQIIFKAGAVALNNSHNYFKPQPLLLFTAAFALYFGTALAWAYLLRTESLGTLYPYMALVFVFVPIGSYVFFGEKFSLQYLLGICLIITGILLCVNKS